MRSLRRCSLRLLVRDHFETKRQFSTYQSRPSYHLRVVLDEKVRRDDCPVEPCRPCTMETKTEGTTNGRLQFPLLGRLDINLEGSIATRIRMWRHHTDHNSRWPLALRFIKGAIHAAIILPVALHAAFAALVVALDHNVQDLGLPASIVCKFRKLG